MTIRTGLKVLAVCFSALAASEMAAMAQWDGTLPPGVRQKLPAFESHSLNRADDAWSRQQYRQAGVEYAAFAHGFPKSPAAPYALFRSARCLHLQEKLAEAAVAYDDVVAAYPTNTATASPAIYFKGACELVTGDQSKAHLTWKELIEDPDYKQHPLAAEALRQVAEYYAGLNEPARAMVMTEKIATEYRKINRDAAWRALQAVVVQYVRNKPDTKKLMELYGKCGGFDPDMQSVPSDLTKDWPFWTRVAALVRANGNFPPEWIGPRRDYHAYWAGVFEPFLGEKDDFRDDVASWYMAADKYEQVHKVALQGKRTPERVLLAADALRLLKRTDEAVALYDEVDKGGGKDAARAAFAAAMAFKDAGNAEKLNARLQDFLKRHPQSPDAARAKAELDAAPRPK